MAHFPMLAELAISFTGSMENLIDIIEPQHVISNIMAF